MNDEPSVGVGEGIGHVGGDPRRLRPVRAVVPHPVTQVGTLDEVGDEVDLPLVHAHVMHRDDSRMPEPSEPARFLEEPIRLRLQPTGAGMQHLDGDGPIELAVVAEVYDAEAAGTKRAPHLVTTEGLGGRRRIGRRRGQSHRVDRRFRHELVGRTGRRRAGRLAFFVRRPGGERHVSEIELPHAAVGRRRHPARCASNACAAAALPPPIRSRVSSASVGHALITGRLRRPVATGRFAKTQSLAARAGTHRVVGFQGTPGPLRLQARRSFDLIAIHQATRCGRRTRSESSRSAKSQSMQAMANRAR